MKTGKQITQSSTSYAKRQADAKPFSTLHFSDIVPIASTNEATAATAFYHLLSLATKGHIEVEQSEAYGEVCLFLSLVARLGWN